MSLHDDMALTFRTVAGAPVSNWPAYAALTGMVLMVAGMVAMMWCLSFLPTLDLRGWLCGAASVAGLMLWRSMLPVAVDRRRRGD